MGSRWWALLTAGVSAVLAWSEWATWRASGVGLPADRLDARCRTPGEVVLVLGYRSRRGARLHPMQRWRTRIAVRSVDPQSARFVFSGAASTDGPSEAVRMADYAVQLGVPQENIALEECARTTWENVAYSLPLLTGAPSITIASNTFHARRARHYLARQSPDLAGRLRRACDYVPGELALIKPVLSLYE